MKIQIVGGNAYLTVMPLAGGQGGFYPTRNLGVQLTLFQPGGADYVHHITASPTVLENPAAFLLEVIRQNIAG